MIYLDSSDSTDGFSYQLFAMAEGAKQSNYQTSPSSSGTSYAWAACEGSGKYLAYDTTNGLSFMTYQDGRLQVDIEWIDEMIYQYGSPAGMYYLVREKK